MKKATPLLNHDDYLTFVASLDSVHESDCDSDNDCDYTDEQNGAYQNNLVVEHENLIKKIFKNHDILHAHKAKIEFLNEERTSYLENFLFLESKHNSFLERNNVLILEIETMKCSSFVNEILPWN